jgi:twitching motility protein PilT
MSVPSNAPPSKSVSLKFSRGDSDPTTIGPAEIDESTEPDSHQHGSSGRSQKPPPLPGTSADRSSRSAAVADISPLSPALNRDHVYAAPSKARTGPPTTLQILAEVIAFAYQERISDLQFQAGRFIYANGSGSTRPYVKWGKLSGETLREILQLFYDHRTIFKGFESQDSHDGALLPLLIAERKLDFACEGKDADGALGVGRFRIQAHFSHQGIGITVRLVSNGITPFEKIGLPANVIESVCQKVTKKQGLGLVVGPTGSGKTTTLVAIIDWLRQHYPKHIVTIEDPIEFVYANTIEDSGGLRPSPALVTQQEVGHHVRSFEQGLNDALRKKPDVILVGEIRTAETLRIALEAVETGHFILSTMHTRGAGKTLGRMRQMFNLEQARGILQQYADVASFILSQGLMPDVTGRYVLCCEYFGIQEIEDRNAIRKYAEGGFQDVEERLNRPGNRKWNVELKGLLNARRITQDVFDQFYQVTGLENK